MNTTLLQEMIAQNYIRVNKHPNCDLYIYNYTQFAQYERVWNEITLACRGLILNESLEIIARPFPKFFNLGEIENQNIPNTSFEVYDKLDGSLGILYWIDDTPYIASRGSFNSDQSNRATAMLHSKYKDSWALLNKKNTYIFEIIYPENRIVLDYGNTEALVLLGIIDTATATELPLQELGFPLVERYDGLNDINALQVLNQDNKEGFVIKFSNNYRLKVKFDEYLRLHRIITEVSNINIWEYLKTNQSMEEILERVPDEFFDWVKNTKTELENQYLAIERQCQTDFKILETVKETALYFQTCPYQSVLFAMLHKRDYAEIIWKRIRPTFEKPFSNIKE
jgi:RNA ligase